MANSMMKGIDLGTTNSSIAVLDGITARVYDNNTGDKCTPSAVWIDAEKRLYVGRLAYQRSEDDPNNSAAEFKRVMGTGMVKSFASSGRSMKPEELSAEVLKSLRADVERAGDELTSAVIGVPAAFDVAAIQATERAAKMAGIGFSVLLQEPVAAAMAYGFQSSESREHWLVYDFGGGTFDAAVIQLRDGMIKVLNHGGDDKLGGRDIDWAIIDKILVPALAAQYSLPDFRRGPGSRWTRAFAKLKLHAEEAKILLSQSEVGPIGIDALCQDGTGKWIRFEYSLKRSEPEGQKADGLTLESLTKPFIRRTIEICRKVLQETRLYNRGAVQRVILVGGPTKMPLLRQMVQDELGIPLDYSVDPMTVVAQGAAIFAATVKAPDRRANARPGQYTVEFEYDPVGIDLDPQVPGAVHPPEGQKADGLTIELVERKTGWRTGKIALNKNGDFVAVLKAEKGRQNLYAIELRDAAGRLLDAAPSEIQYTVGNAPTDQTSIHSLSVGLANNETRVLLRKGETLPAKKRAFLQTVSRVRKGEAGALLRVPVIEGENTRADRNRLVGALELTGSDVSRDVPPGSEVEVAIEMDASRRVTAEADIPILDKLFTIDVCLERPDPKPDELRAKLASEKSRLQRLGLQAQELQAPEARDLAEELRSRMESLDECFQNVEADLDAAERCQALLLELQVSVDQLEEIMEWPEAVADSEQAIRAAQEVVDRWGEPGERKQMETIKGQIHAAVSAHDLDTLKSRTEQVWSLAREIGQRQPEWLISMLSRLLGQALRMTDQEMAGRLFTRAAEYAKNKDMDGLNACVRQLAQLLPEDDETKQAIMKEFHSTVMSGGLGRG
jgi:molecular chaperone DnaK